MTLPVLTMLRHTLLVLVTAVGLLSCLGGSEIMSSKSANNVNQTSISSHNLSDSLGFMRRVVLKDTNANTEIKVVMTNRELINLLEVSGGFQVGPHQSVTEQLRVFLVRHRGNPLQIDFAEANKAYSSNYLDRFSVKHTYSLRDLHVGSNEQLLRVFFGFDHAKGVGVLKEPAYTQFKDDPAFIALIIDMGFSVVKGDYVNNLTIYGK